jgi:RNA-directed DNA polymerase
VTDRAKERQPAAVPEAKQAGETPERWKWVEPSVWTERMLAALEKGVKGGKWFSLIDKVYTLANLRSAFGEVKRNRGAAGVDHQTIAQYEEHLEENLRELSEQLKEERYVPQAVRRVWIAKPGSKEKRPLGVPTVRDRVVQAAVRHVMEPIYEKEFAEHSYGFRPGRGCKDALRRVDELLGSGWGWVVDADLKSYFDTIPHEKLMKCIEEKVSDGRVLKLVQGFLRQEIVEEMKGWRPEEGTPQGAVLSPLLSNIYLNALDWEIGATAAQMIRYADDFVILCRSREQAHEALERVGKWVREAGLTLHPEKTRIVDMAQAGGFDFLGYHFEGGRKWPREKSLQRLQDRIRDRTRRSSGQSLKRIIEETNRSLIGWFGYFKHSHRSTFPKLDAWVRMRLRSILRKRNGRRGRGRGIDHQRWPNAFFSAQGLFSLTRAHAQACQPS